MYFFKQRIYIFLCIIGAFLSFPSVVSAEAFYILPRLGLNIAFMESGEVTNVGNKLKLSSSTDAAFVITGAFGVHFTRVPVRLEVDLALRTPAKVRGADGSGTNYINAKILQLNPMAFVYYDIYLASAVVVPYLGAGFGFTTFFVDTSAQIGGTQYDSDARISTKLTWGLVGGIGIPIESILLDFAFRFTSSGKADIAGSSLNGNVNIMNFDLLFGVRFLL